MRDIPFSKVDCSGNELKYIREVIESGWLTTAGKCSALEARFREKIGCKYACAVNSATAALHLACEAVGIGPGDKVFVPTMTFTASAEVVRYMGADPVFLDVEYGTCLITPEILNAAIQQYPDAKALMLVHFGGQAA
ncbi:MAG: DegT/DnrJ/EryC1/StrS family aminotransferase, partial [Kiritimatiellae bacterium]|nr:DegT/DnrJ/EryC1/StrS family aminotransferase [Kiritimatiellia bacterium]